MNSTITQLWFIDFCLKVSNYDKNKIATLSWLTRCSCSDGHWAPNARSRSHTMDRKGSGHVYMYLCMYLCTYKRLYVLVCICLYVYVTSQLKILTEVKIAPRASYLKRCLVAVSFWHGAVMPVSICSSSSDVREARQISSQKLSEVGMCPETVRTTTEGIIWFISSIWRALYRTSFVIWQVLFKKTINIKQH